LGFDVAKLKLRAFLLLVVLLMLVVLLKMVVVVVVVLCWFLHSFFWKSLNLFRFFFGFSQFLRKGMKGRDWLFLFEFDIMGAEVAFQFRMIFFFIARFLGLNFIGGDNETNSFC
jgi:hypothetical protein